MIKKKILVIAAHPDDEVIGCGGTIAKYISQGHKVRTIILSQGIASRSHNQKTILKKIAKLKKSSFRANNALGVKSLLHYDFPDNKFDTVPILKIIKTIEREIKKFEPSILFTHFNNDLNIDHEIASRAVITAARPEPGKSVNKIFFFEISSSTDFQIHNPKSAFIPNTFIDISKSLNKKAKALRLYGSEMRKSPHSRSINSIINLAKTRGASSGLIAAEAFVLAREISK